MEEHADILKENVKNYIHQGKQFPKDRAVVFLTVHHIGELTGTGRLDFGGSEYAEAETPWKDPVKMKKDDQYGWWHLTPGSYLVEFNETVQVPAGSRFYLQSWEKAGRNAAVIPFSVIDSPRAPLFSILHVGGEGIDIKENARLAELGVLD